MRGSRGCAYSTAEDAVTFFSESSPLGVVGSFILDKFAEPESAVFSFKHRYLPFALDNGVMMDLLAAIHSRQKVGLEFATSRQRIRKQAVIMPLKIYISTQGGRQYVAAYSAWQKRISFFRLDAIAKIKALEAAPDYEALQSILQEERQNIWGVSRGCHRLERLEMALAVEPKDMHIIKRLEREKRGGEVEWIDEGTWRFTVDVYDAWELIPWLRTFIGRIASLTCSNRKVERRFWADYAALADMYGGDNNAV